MHIQATEGGELAALETLGSIGPTILKTAVATNFGDLHKMQSLGSNMRVFQTDPSSAEKRYKVSPEDGSVEEGSVEEEVLKSLDINNTLAFNALFDQLHERNLRLAKGYESLVDYDSESSDEEHESSYPVEGMLV